VAEGKGLGDDVLELLRSLQTRLKLGLSNSLEMWLYSQGYVDREVCNRLGSVLNAQGVDSDVFDSDILRTYHQVVSECIGEFPSYFSG
ncbi:hypothetical protein LZT27_05315, partial [Aeromonas veronii]